MEGARKILLSITGGRDLSLWEVNEAAKAVSEAAHPEANIIFGAMVDEKLDDQVWVTVVATGYGDAAARARGAPAARGARGRAAACSAAPSRRVDRDREPAARGLARAPQLARRDRARRAGVHPAGLTWPVPAVSSPPATRSPRRPARGCCARAATRSTPRWRRCSTSLVAEPLLTGLGAGGYCSSPASAPEPVAAGLLRRRAGPRRRRGAPASCCPVDVSFGDAVAGLQRRRRVRAGRTGRRGHRARRARAGARCRWPTSPRPRSRWRATGVAAQRAAGLRLRDPRRHPDARRPRAAALFAPEGGVLREGEPFRWAELGDAIERLGAEGAAPFYTGDMAGGGPRRG